MSNRELQKRLVIDKSHQLQELDMKPAVFSGTIVFLMDNNRTLRDVDFVVVKNLDKIIYLGDKKLKSQAVVRNIGSLVVCQYVVMDHESKIEFEIIQDAFCVFEDGSSVNTTFADHHYEDCLDIPVDGGSIKADVYGSMVLKLLFWRNANGKQDASDCFTLSKHPDFQQDKLLKRADDLNILNHIEKNLKTIF